MPIDKFGRTDTGGTTTIERVVTGGGVTLSQVGDSFLQRDGSNAATGNINLNHNKLINVGNPSEENDGSNKHYVDDAIVTKVSRSGDTIAGNLMLTIGRDHLRTLGCNDLNENATFTIFLGTDQHELKCRPGHPITFETVNGLSVKLEGHDLIKIGTSSSDRRIQIHSDIMMNKHFIANLPNPNSPLDAANKAYVDGAVAAAVSSTIATPKKNLVGYIPQLEANDSRAGFVTRASSGNVAFGAKKDGNLLQTSLLVGCR